MVNTVFFCYIAHYFDAADLLMAPKSRRFFFKTSHTYLFIKIAAILMKMGGKLQLHL